MQEGKPISVQIFNDTDTPEFVHSHGQFIPSEVDGAGEEKSIVVSPHGQVRYEFTPQPAGFRWVHTYVIPGSNLYSGLYTGQFGPVYVEPKDEKGDFDQEVFLVTHEFNPYFISGEMEDEEDQGKPEDPSLEAEVEGAKGQKPNGWEIAYETFTINGRCLGYGDPIRVKEGQRTIFRLEVNNGWRNRRFSATVDSAIKIAVDPIPTKVSCYELPISSYRGRLRLRRQRSLS